MLTFFIQLFFGAELYHYSPYVYPDGLEVTSLVRAAQPYSLPSEIADNVALVDKLVRLPHLSQTPLGVPVGSSRSSNITSKGNNINNASTEDPFMTCAAAAPACAGATTPAVLRAR